MSVTYANWRAVGLALPRRLLTAFHLTLQWCCTSTLTELHLESDAATGNADAFAPTDEAGKETSAHREVREDLAVRMAGAILLTASLTNGADAAAPASRVDMEING
ncbi:MAG TPA: hypothetical protein VII69_14260 [Candidatus Eremiobacteraceae bacterium]